MRFTGELKVITGIFQGFTGKRGVKKTLGCGLVGYLYGLDEN